MLNLWRCCTFLLKQGHALTRRGFSERALDRFLAMPYNKIVHIECYGVAMGATRSKIARENDRVQVAKMYLEGKTQQQIADALGIDQSTVSRDLKAIYKNWQSAAVEDIAKLRGVQLARYNMLYREVFSVWETKKSPAHMKRIIEILAAINKLLGLDQPELFVSFDIDYRNLTDEELERIARGEHPSTVLATTGSSGA